MVLALCKCRVAKTHALSYFQGKRWTDSLYVCPLNWPMVTSCPCVCLHKDGFCVEFCNAGLPVVGSQNTHLPCSAQWGGSEISSLALIGFCGATHERHWCVWEEGSDLIVFEEHLCTSSPWLVVPHTTSCQLEQIDTISVWKGMCGNGAHNCTISKASICRPVHSHAE